MKQQQEALQKMQQEIESKNNLIKHLQYQLRETQ